MKKAKFMLSAIALVTLVGGAFAFKAHNASTGNLFCSPTLHGTPVGKYTSVPNPQGTPSFCTTVSNGDATIPYRVITNL